MKVKFLNITSIPLTKTCYFIVFQNSYFQRTQYKMEIFYTFIQLKIYIRENTILF